MPKTRIEAQDLEEYLPAISRMLIELHAQNSAIMSVLKHCMAEVDMPEEEYLRLINEQRELNVPSAADAFNRWVFEARINKIK